jgi:hypothetical protein
MRKHTKILTAMALLVVALASCNGYEDGPAISLRSKHERMTFTRPITKYAVNGVDSLAGLLDIFRAECPGFVRDFTFQYDLEEYYGFITWSDSSMLMGTWSNLGDLKSISMTIARGQPFPSCCWDVMRLSHKALWLQMETGSTVRELRFEND